jgi:hypothetical protein
VIRKGEDEDEKKQMRGDRRQKMKIFQNFKT